MPVVIRQSSKEDIGEIRAIHNQAFGEAEGPVIVELVEGLLNDETAKPLLSLLAVEQGRALGHVLFTATQISPSTEGVLSQILAPLAVAEECRGQGIGGKLIEEGLSILRARGVSLVFVLGYPDYYGKFGFKPAGVRGFEAPYPILEKNADAWMVKELESGIIGSVVGQVRCAKALDEEKYWQE